MKRQKNIFLLVSISLLITLFIGCSAIQYSASTDENLCPVPPPDAFSTVGMDFKMAEANFGKISLGSFTFESKPEIISLASKAATDDRIWRWMECLEEIRNGYEPCQVQWFRRSREFMKTNPTPEQYITWEKEFPFPITCDDKKLSYTEPITNSKEKTNWTDISNRFSMETWERDKTIWGAGNSIKLFENNTIAKITSTKGRNAVWIESKRFQGPGTYLIEAKVKADSLIQMSHENFYRGKFQVVLVKNGRDYEWPTDDDFLSTNGWSKRSVSTELDKGETGVFRIGLQRTKGVVWVRDVKVYKKNK